MWDKNQRYLIKKLIKANFRDYIFNIRNLVNPAKPEFPGVIAKLPPASLRIRVGEPRRERFLGNGRKICNKLLLHVQKHRPVNGFKNVLDWGCGCGRVTRHVLCHIPANRLTGCDIDPQAISWMIKNIQDSRFVAVDPHPPTPFENNQFDFIYGISVFTHLDEKIQFRWLEELKRICSADGIIAVSVHGGISRKRPELSSLLEEKGFADMKGNKTFLFKDLEDQDYYRETKHSKEYILREWTKYFHILDFIEHGLGRQDLVIMTQKKT